MSQPAARSSRIRRANCWMPDAAARSPRETGAGKRTRNRARTLSVADTEWLHVARWSRGRLRAPQQSAVRRFQRQLLRWYGHHARTFPWRRTRNPYRVLIAELFLQKTQAKQVLPTYRAFIRRFRNVQTLARAPLRQLREAIWSLGLPARARQLKGMARALVDHFAGQVPLSEKELLSLQGVGPYTASAVLCFAFGKRRAVVDANVIRLLARYFGLRSTHPRPRTDKKLWRIAEVIVPAERFREYNWAIFDFAAKICRAKNPLCGRCPLNRDCRWYLRTRLSPGLRPATRP